MLRKGAFNNIIVIILLATFLFASSGVLLLRHSCSACHINEVNFFTINDCCNNTEQSKHDCENCKHPKERKHEHQNHKCKIESEFLKIKDLISYEKHKLIILKIAVLYQLINIDIPVKKLNGEISFPKKILPKSHDLNFICSLLL